MLKKAEGYVFPWFTLTHDLAAIVQNDLEIIFED